MLVKLLIFFKLARRRSGSYLSMIKIIYIYKFERTEKGICVLPKNTILDLDAVPCPFFVC